MPTTCLRPSTPRPQARLLVALIAGSLLAACGGSGAPGSSDPAHSPVAPAPSSTPPSVVLKAPVLSFTDTGVSLSDGVTFNGKWLVESDALGWEYSLDQGQTWTRGSGDSFVVQGDGTKLIWVRSRDDLGNTSEIVMVNCVLDTVAPPPVSVTPMAQGITRTLQIAGLEPGARWAYSIDEQTTWREGVGAGLGVLGNSLSRIWLRQTDMAGNVSAAQPVVLEAAGSDGWHEASGNPLQPSALVTSAHTLLIHGTVVRGDADYVRWDVPAGHRLASVRLVHYLSDDAVAFYALQRSAVFDAGFDVSKMLVYGHMGPLDLSRNVIAALPAEQLGAGPMTLWFQQTGALPTRYAMEVVFQPLP